MKKSLSMILVSQFLALGTVMAQSQFSGKVLSQSNGEPVVGATVRVAGSSVGTVTDVNGNFSLTLPVGGKELKVSYVGMDEKTVRIQGANMTIMLTEDEHSLNEVVVTGYGVTRKAAFTGAASVLSKDVVGKRNDANPIKSLEGSVPGLQLSTTSGQPGAPQTIYIRGRNSINSDTQPLKQGFFWLQTRLI